MCPSELHLKNLSFEQFFCTTVYIYNLIKVEKVLLQMRTVLLRAKVYDLIKVELPSPEELPCTQLLLSHIQTCSLTNSWTIQANLV